MPAYELRFYRKRIDHENKYEIGPSRSIPITAPDDAAAINEARDWITLDAWVSGDMANLIAPSGTQVWGDWKSDAS